MDQHIQLGGLDLNNLFNFLCFLSKRKPDTTRANEEPQDVRPKHWVFFTFGVFFELKDILIRVEICSGLNILVAIKKKDGKLINWKFAGFDCCCFGRRTLEAVDCPLKNYSVQFIFLSQILFFHHTVIFYITNIFSSYSLFFFITRLTFRRRIFFQPTVGQLQKFFLELAYSENV